MTQQTLTIATLQPVVSYLVLVRPMLVATHIGSTIADHSPAANVIVVQSAEEACLALKAIRTIRVAFLGLAPASDKCCRIAAAVRARGGRLVFIGDEAEELGPGKDWIVLCRPFSTESVIAALKGRFQSRSSTLARERTMIVPQRMAAWHVGRHPG